MTAHVMTSKGAAYVLDCGLGITNQFARTGIPFANVRSIFITHHHPDHNIEYGPFLLIGWVQGMTNSLRAFGPPPLKQMTDDFVRAYKATVDFWVAGTRTAIIISHKTHRQFCEQGWPGHFKGEIVVACRQKR
jgi:ribonuclease BN (tRNA processing enzyme)